MILATGGAGFIGSHFVLDRLTHASEPVLRLAGRLLLPERLGAGGTGDGQQRRDWLYVGDHCSAIRRVLEAGQAGAIYNVGGWNEKANLEVVTLLCDILDKLQPRADGQSYRSRIAFVTDPAARRPANLRLDTSRFRTGSGLRLPPWQDGVRQVLRQILQSEHDA